MKFPELSALYDQPLFDLISKSRAVHLEHWRGEEVQRCSLLSIKTGGCSEDCAYCAQSAHYSTGVEREELLSVENVLAAARRARLQGAGRFCMGVIFAFMMIYACGFAGVDVIAGIRLGILLEIAAIGMRLAIFAVQPFPGKLIVYGSVSGLIEMIIVGAIVGAIYKPASARTP